MGCSSCDGRYTIAALTDAGYDVVAAAPTHVRAVRPFVLDPLTVTDQKALELISTKLRVRPVDLARVVTPAREGAGRATPSRC